MRVLVTRPRADAATLVSELEGRGCAVLVEPMLEIVTLPDSALPIDGAQGILVTSANGVRALAARHSGRNLPVWAVGEASAAAARAAGFFRVEAAGGDVDALAALVRQRADPAAGPLLHVAGTHRAGDLAALLADTGFTVRRAVLYEARASDALSDGAREALERGRLDAALFFSPRAAATFVTLARAAAVDAACAGIAAYGLSKAVAGALAPLPWRIMRVAARPTQTALLAALADDFPAGPITA